MPTGDTVIRRWAPRAAAQATAARISSAVAELENCASGVAARALKSIAAKRDSSHTVGSLGGGKPLSNCGKTSSNR